MRGRVTHSFSFFRKERPPLLSNSTHIASDGLVQQLLPVYKENQRRAGPLVAHLSLCSLWRSSTRPKLLQKPKRKLEEIFILSR